MTLLDENDDIDDLDNDDIADPDFLSQPVNQREATMNLESESDEEDDDNSITDILSSPPSKKKNKRIALEKRPLNPGDRLWQSTQSDFADDDDLRT